MIIDSIVSGTLSSYQLDKLLRVRHKLVSKKGCPVMCFRNFDNELINGTNGFVTSFIDNFLVIYFPKVNRVQYFSSSWKVLYVVNKDGKVGKHLQLPLTLSYLFTIHKSQGMALDNGELNVDRLFSPGQGYPGLSRFKTRETVRLLNYDGSEPINIASNEVIHYYNSLDVRISTCIDSPICSSSPSELSCCCFSTSNEQTEKKSPQDQSTTASQSVISQAQNSGDEPVDRYSNSDDSTYEEDGDDDNNVDDHDIFNNSRVFVSSANQLTFSPVECLNQLSTSYLSMSESSNNVDVCAFIQEVYDSESLLLMFNKFLCYIWKKVSDIIHSSSSGQTSRDYSLTSAQAEDMFFTIERLVTKKQIKSRWFF